MSTLAFVTAVLALLAAPGPTNTLMCLAGAAGGPRRVVRLLPAELLGYLAAIVPLAWLGSHVLDHVPLTAAVLKIAAAAWVMVLAVRLWTPPVAGAGRGAVGLRSVFVTTLLNPKALVFGLVLLPPPGDPAFAPRLGLFCLLVAAVAVAWGTAGSLARVGGDLAGRMRAIHRIASVWLSVVAAGLVAGVLGA
jgi:threonine/homoserine/homoserine lactone efflux protein